MLIIRKASPLFLFGWEAISLSTIASAPPLQTGGPDSSNLLKVNTEHNSYAIPASG
jgi:hypothetical protein